jgi:hypothetical protein
MKVKKMKGEISRLNREIAKHKAEITKLSLGLENILPVEREVTIGTLLKITLGSKTAIYEVSALKEIVSDESVTIYTKRNTTTGGE